VSQAISVIGGVVMLDGSLRIEDMGGVANQLMQQAAQDGDLSIDLAGIGEFDSGLVALLAACRHSKLRQGQEMVLHNVPPRLLELFRVYGLAGQFPS
jgi:ABC-type transporter Mla MlaB component